jgi:flagellar biosynthesis/type III secretory pathway M-ring protein FliF/YscJ
MTWAAVTKFFTDNPIARWIAWAVVALIGWEAVKRHLKDAGRKAERQASAVKQAQAREAVVTRSAEIITEERGNSDAALEARDNINPAPSFDELPDEVQRVLSRNPRGGETS